MFCYDLLRSCDRNSKTAFISNFYSLFLNHSIEEIILSYVVLICDPVSNLDFNDDTKI